MLVNTELCKDELIKAPAFPPSPFHFVNHHRVYRQYSFQFIPIMGKILAGDSESYQYLVESIERFPSQPDFAQL